MSNKKNKKRQHSRTVDLKRQMEQERLANEKDRSKNRWNPAGRALLWGDLVFLAISSCLGLYGLISPQVEALCTIISVILLFAALWLLFGSKKGRNRPDQGPRL